MNTSYQEDKRTTNTERDPFYNLERELKTCQEIKIFTSGFEQGRGEADARGHKKLETTQIYTKVSSQALGAIKSSLD